MVLETSRLQDGQEYFTPAVANNEYLDKLGIVKLEHGLNRAMFLLENFTAKRFRTPRTKITPCHFLEVHHDK